MTAWVSAGFAPSEFWEQTPDTFSAVMKGARKRIELDAEGALQMAHTQAGFSALAHHGKLEPLSKYRPKPPETLNEVMGKWAALEAAGYPIKIRGNNGD